MKRTLLFILSALLLAGFASAGGGRDLPEPENYLNLSLGSGLKTLDPALSNEIDIGNNLFEGLIREREGVIHPGMAESWTVSADGKTYTFRIREAFWSDGTPLTAYDFEYSWKRSMDPALGAEWAWLWEYTNVAGAREALNGTIAPDEAGVSAVDDRTLIVDLVQPTEYFLGLISLVFFHPVRETAVAAGADGTWSMDPELCVSNGPFRMAEYSIGEGLVMVRNEQYWNADNVQIDRINMMFINSPSTAYSAYRNGELDLIFDVPPSEVPRLVAEDPDFHIFPILGTYFYNFNLDLDIWQDARVRRAMTLAIDRGEIVTVLGQGNVPATGLIAPGLLDHAGRDFSIHSGDYDIPSDDSGYDEARELMAAAGYPDGEGFPEFELLYNTGEGHKLIAEIIQEMWKVNLGITCRLENQEWAVFQTSRLEGNFELSRGGWVVDFPDPMGFLAIFQSDNLYNRSNYVNRDYDTLVSGANIAGGRDHFEPLYAAEEILMSELPFIPVYHYTDSYLVSPVLQDWSRSVLGWLDFSTARVER